MLDFEGADALMNPIGGDPIALARLFASNPEAVLPQLIAAGIPPPPKAQMADASGGLDALTATVQAAQANPSPLSQIAGSSIGGPGDVPSAAKLVAPQPPAPPAQPSYMQPTLGGFAASGPQGFAPSMGPDSFGGGSTPVGGFPRVSGYNAPPAAPPMAQAPGAPLDLTSEAQKAGTPEAKVKSKSELDNLMRAFSGLRPPPAPAIQKLDSPRLPATHAMGNANPVLALIQQVLGQSKEAGGLRLGQAVHS